MNALLDFLIGLAPYKTDTSSVLHVWWHPAGWPHEKDETFFLAREDHFFGSPTITIFHVPCAVVWA